jgi:hypothetical protein
MGLRGVKIKKCRSKTKKIYIHTNRLWYLILYMFLLIFSYLYTLFSISLLTLFANLGVLQYVLSIFTLIEKFKTTFYHTVK